MKTKKQHRNLTLISKIMKVKTKQLHQLRLKENNGYIFYALE